MNTFQPGQLVRYTRYGDNLIAWRSLGIVQYLHRDGDGGSVFFPKVCNVSVSFEYIEPATTTQQEAIDWILEIARHELERGVSGLGLESRIGDTLLRWYDKTYRAERYEIEEQQRQDWKKSQEETTKAYWLQRLRRRNSGNAVLF